MRTFLATEERNKLVAAVGGLYDFTDQGARGRRVLLQTAGLGRLLPGIDLTGTPRTVAADVVLRLEGHGQLRERPNYHALGALAAAMLDLNELDSETAADTARLIVRYSLVADPAYIERLRENYAVVDKVVRPASAGAAAPARGSTQAPEGPQFNPAIDDQAALETVINSADNFIDLFQLRRALYCSQAVGRVEAPAGNALGTGFLVGPDLLLTNQHVLKDESYLEEAVVRFGYLNDAAGVVPEEGAAIGLVRGWYHFSPAEDLDYALVRLQEAPLAKIAASGDLAQASIEEMVAAGKHRGYLTPAPRTLIDHARVNILQHPDGEPLKVVLTQNYVVHRADTRIQYVADTKDGSSGSPVFDNRWDVVALHHSGSPYPPDDPDVVRKKKWKGQYRVNEGIPMRAILDDFRQRGLDRHLPRS